jgi:guanine deaminase
MSPSETRTIFYGPLVNPESLSYFQAFPRCLIAVAASGQIDWIEEDVHESALLNVLAQHGSLDVPLVNLRHGEFILPGFVDTHTVRILLFKAVRLRALCSPLMAGPP